MKLYERLLSKYISDGILNKQQFDKLFSDYQASLSPVVYHGIEGEDYFGKYVDLVLDNCSNIRNVYLPFQNVPHYRKGHFAEVDSLLVHNTGIFIVEYKNYKGSIFGNAAEQEWSLAYSNGNSYTIKNQIQQLEYHLDRTKRFLADNGFPDTIPIYACLVYADSASIEIDGNTTKINILSQYEFLRRVRLIANTQSCISNEMCKDIVASLNEYSDSSMQMKYIHNLILMGTMERWYNEYFSKQRI